MTSSDYQQHLSNFYSVLKEKLGVYRDSKRHLDRFLSTDFNVFKWIKTDENLLSDIIKDLLDQNGAHGQQRKFLDAFLQVIKRPDLKDKKLPKVGREVWTDHNSENPYRRIDIVVEFENKAFGLGIENKLEADEQPKQLQDYHDHLKNKYGANGFCLVFITPDGRKPNSIEPNLREELMNEKKLVCVSYSTDILKWLEECCRLGESDKFRWFLRDFRDHMNGGQTMSMPNEKETILKHALEKENLETALDIGFAFNDDGGELHKRIIVGFLNNLEEFVLDKLGDPDALEWNVNDETLRHNPLGTDFFSFGKKSWKNRYGVGLQPYEDKLIIGVWDLWPSEELGELEERLRKKLKDELNSRFEHNGKQANNWPWYYYLDDPYRNWDGKETFIKLHNGEAVAYLGPYLVQIIEVAAPIIDEHIRGS